MKDSPSAAAPETAAPEAAAGGRPLETARPRPPGRFFYGWRVVAAACLQGMFGNGAISTGFPRFFEPIRGDLGLSYAAMSLVFSLAPGRGRLRRAAGRLAGGQVRLPADDPLWRPDRRPGADAAGLCAGILAAGLSIRRRWCP